MITRFNKYYFQDPSIEWGYHMDQDSRLLLEWNFDYTPSYLKFHSSPGVGLISPLTFGNKQVCMYKVYKQKIKHK